MQNNNQIIRIIDCYLNSKCIFIKDKDACYKYVFDKLNNDYKDNITKDVEKILDEYIKMLFKDDNTIILLINEYIYKTVKKDEKDYNKIIKVLNNIWCFCEDNNYTLNQDIIKILIKTNKILRNILFIIIRNDNKRLEEKGIYKVYEDICTLLFVKTYAEEEGINIDNAKEYFLDNDEEYFLDNDEDELDSSYSNNYSDSIKIYLNDIRKYKLLTPEEEYELALKIKNGDEKAKQRFINSNLRLVVFIAKKYQNRGLELLDLIQNGNLGLIKAIDKFNPDLGFKFSTCASWWIMQEITRAIADTGKTIRIPVHMSETINKFKKIQHKMTIELGRTPTYDELVDKMGIDKEKIIEIFKLLCEPVSLETPVGDEDDSEIKDFISSDNDLVEDRVEDEIYFNMLKENLKKLLTKRELDIYFLRIGLYDGRIYTLDEIGKKYGVSKERIRQIERKVEKKIIKNKDIILNSNYDRVLREKEEQAQKKKKNEKRRKKLEYKMSAEIAKKEKQTDEVMKEPKEEIYETDALATEDISKETKTTTTDDVQIQVFLNDLEYNIKNILKNRFEYESIIRYKTNLMLSKNKIPYEEAEKLALKSYKEDLEYNFKNEIRYRIYKMLYVFNRHDINKLLLKMSKEEIYIFIMYDYYKKLSPKKISIIKIKRKMGQILNNENYEIEFDAEYQNYIDETYKIIEEFFSQNTYSDDSLNTPLITPYQLIRKEGALYD